MPEQSAADEVERLRKQDMTKVMEVYKLSDPIEDQLAERRAFRL